MHGHGRDRNIVIAFPDFQSTVFCYTSPEYQFAIEECDPSAQVDVIIVAGADGPQPA